VLDTLEHFYIAETISLLSILGKHSRYKHDFFVVLDHYNEPHDIINVLKIKERTNNVVARQEMSVTN